MKVKWISFCEACFLQTLPPTLIPFIHIFFDTSAFVAKDNKEEDNNEEEALKQAVANENSAVEGGMRIINAFLFTVPSI